MGICWAAGQKVQTAVKENYGLMVVRTSVDMKSRGLTIIRCPAPLLPSLVEVTAGAHEAADHGRNDRHKQQDGGGDAS